LTPEAQHIQRVFLTLTFFSTLSTSLIWGINTLFLLNAGLNNFEAFTANAFFTVGQVIFEIPTGIVADFWGRRLSYLLGAITLMVSTLAYVFFWTFEAPFWMWALVSIFLGLGFTFFSGATEAWLVDAMEASGYTGDLEPVFAKGQISIGAAMLLGSVAGGVIAQISNLAIPYILRAFLLIITFVIAFIFMKDKGFTPAKLEHLIQSVRKQFIYSFEYGLKNRPVRWLMLSMPFTLGAGIYGFYALQPYLLELYGNPNAYSIAGLAAAGVAGAQILGGLLIPYIRQFFSRRTTILLSLIFLGSLALLFLGIVANFYFAVLMVSIWAISFAMSEPIYQALINSLIPSKQRATILSLSNLMGSSGGVVTQPLLGRAADIWGYGITYVMTSGVTVLGAVFFFLLRLENTPSDHIDKRQ
jgi:MFS family permease